MIDEVVKKTSDRQTNIFLLDKSGFKITQLVVSPVTGQNNHMCVHQSCTTFYRGHKDTTLKAGKNSTT